SQSLPEMIVKHHRPTQDVPSLIDLILGLVDAPDVDVSAKAADEIRSFAFDKGGISKAAVELLETSVDSSREYQNAVSELVCRAAIIELPILHGGQEVLQPAKRLVIEVRVELIKEDHGHTSAKRFITHLMESRDEVLRPRELADVKGECPVGKDFGGTRDVGDHGLDSVALARSRRS